MKIKKGDKVKVLNGKDKGKTGKVLKILRDDLKVIVEGINIVTKFEKKTNEQKKGGIIKVEGPMSVSKVQLIDDKTDKPGRVRYVFENGKKIRTVVSNSKKTVVKKDTKATSKKDNSKTKLKK